jgi:uncharacterized protein (UPF0147 family)
MELNSVVEMLEDISNDGSVPRNIRSSTQEAAERLKDNSKDISVRINAAVSILDDVSNDPNLPVHARTKVWHIASTLETLSKKP